MNERLTIISNAIYDDDFINLVRPNYQNYLDGQSKIPYYIHAGGDYEHVGFTGYFVKKLEKTLNLLIFIIYFPVFRYFIDYIILNFLINVKY